MTDIPILDMTPINSPYEREPRYSFHTSLPARGVRVLPGASPDPRAAYEHGRKAVAAYEARDPMGNMGVVCGVTKNADDGGYQAVICLFHSNT